MPHAFICEGRRTPIGRYGGALAHVRTDDLAAMPLAALRQQLAEADWERVEEVYYGCSNQAGEDCRNVARMALLLSGLPTAVPGVTINRLCASGMDAVVMAGRAIAAGEMSVAIAGGVESMSRSPIVMPKPTTTAPAQVVTYDSTIGWRFTNPEIARRFGTACMPETAENVAAAYKIDRCSQDGFALLSQQRAAAAKKAGFFRDEITPVESPANGTKTRLVAEDEQPRPDVTPELLARLPTPFRQNGTVTAGNASGINDGACAMFVADEPGVTAMGLRPRARILGAATAGVDPNLMGVGPLTAIEKLLMRAKLRVVDIDLWEIHEAFAAQVLAVTRSLRLEDGSETVNPNGGAIALGNPIGMSGARLVLTAARQLQRSGGRYGVAAIAVGLGQGMAVLLARV